MKKRVGIVGSLDYEIYSSDVSFFLSSCDILIFLETKEVIIMAP